MRVFLSLLICLMVLLYFNASSEICNVSSSEKSYFDKSLRRCCSQCPPGTKVSKVCTATQDTQCEECPLGHFTDIWHTSLDCERCNNHCDEKYNLIEVQPCRNQTQRKCDCKPGYICTYLMSSTCLTCTPIVIPGKE
ncbi:tumor necrosis factor receptor superfamily member 1B-like [Polypterus senegalus]|uniref:tumor necrosis factor receptor superfamily member 1B-like n=1 Tax=Polypterus senegalus TaxID=55291 RepID=UPI001965970D|nr:tumor necrosis factor receptor superfamily member 1B-like [Polypterus senegalus]